MAFREKRWIGLPQRSCRSLQTLTHLSWFSRREVDALLLDVRPLLVSLSLQTKRLEPSPNARERASIANHEGPQTATNLDAETQASVHLIKVT